MSEGGGGWVKEGEGGRIEDHIDNKAEHGNCMGITLLPPK